MAKRFFKLLYVIALIGIVVSLPIYVLSSAHFDRVVITSYKAKCNLSNNYVVLEGSQLNDPYIFDEIILNDSTYSDTKKTLNFYCQNYDAVQPYVIAYANSKTREEQVTANKNFFNFQEKVMPSVYTYPPSYQLEEVSHETHLYEIYSPIIDWALGAILAFIVLQIIKICYVYVTFGEIVLHPFKQHKKKDNA
jgi:hypothetical protein